MQDVLTRKQLRTAHLFMLCSVPLYWYVGHAIHITLPHYAVYVAVAAVFFELFYFPIQLRRLRRLLTSATVHDRSFQGKFQTRMFSLFSSGTIVGAAAWALQVSDEPYWGVYFIAVGMLVGSGALLYEPMPIPGE